MGMWKRILGFEKLEKETERIQKRVYESTLKRLSESNIFPELKCSDFEPDRRLREDLVREEARRRVYGSPYPIRLREEVLALLYSFYEE